VCLTAITYWPVGGGSEDRGSWSDMLWETPGGMGGAGGIKHRGGRWLGQILECRGAVPEDPSRDTSRQNDQVREKSLNVQPRWPTLYGKNGWHGPPP
jgi:hypothetical protein